MNISLDALETLDAIEREGSFSAAARALHKVPSAVSYAVAQLEDAVGVALFVRQGRRAHLTDAGRAIVDEARAVLARARRLEGLAARFRDGWEPTLRVVLDGIVPMTPVLRVLRDFGRDDVPTRLQLRVEFLGGVQDRFEAVDADLMVVKAWTPSPHLVARHLPDVTVVLVASGDHPLCAAAEPVGADQLHEHVELTVHDSSRSSRVVDHRRFGGSRVFLLSDFASKREALLMGLGYGWMPLALVADDLDAGRLAEVRWDAGSRYAFAPALVHRADRPPGRAGRRFADALAEALAPSGPVHG